MSARAYWEGRLLVLRRHPEQQEPRPLTVTNRTLLQPANGCPHASSVMAMTSISLTQLALERPMTHLTRAIRSCGGIIRRLSCGVAETTPFSTLMVPMLPGLRQVTA